ESDNLIASAKLIDTSISAPEGYSVRYSRAIEIEAMALNPLVTFRIVYPEAIRRGARVYKIVGQNVYDITSMVDIRGSTITFTIADNSIYDGNSTQGIIKDPIVLMEPLQEPASGGGGGGCSTGGFGNSVLVWMFLFGLMLLRRFKG
ncbi:MAG: choice-of-anchor U domain-containing protein, partial [Aquificaceae bacterium]